jgi:hypothetical protein
LFTYIPSTLCYRAPVNDHKLVGVYAYLDPVIQQSKERSQRQCSHEYGNETILDDQLQVLVEEAMITERDEIVVSLPTTVHGRFILFLVLTPVDETFHVAKRRKREETHTL